MNNRVREQKPAAPVGHGNADRIPRSRLGLPGPLLVLLVMLVLLTGCASLIPEGEFSPEIQSDIPALRLVYRDDFRIGAAVEPGQLEGPQADLLRYHFNSLTAENAMKFRSIHPEQNRWNFEPADRIADFARNNGMTMRGHTFVWHHPDEIAPWVFTADDGSRRSRDEVLSLLEEHIRTLMERYGDVVSAWDVVNEAIDPAQPDGMRRTPWYEAIGPDYLDQVFHIAHRINPDAKLFYNDYMTYDPVKGQFIYDLLKGMLDRAVPVGGIGMQMHLTLSYPETAAVAATLEKFRELGLEIHITELDMSLYTQEFEQLDEAPTAYRIHQGHRYRALMDIYRANADLVDNVTFWGFHDGHTWLTREPYNRPDWPLPFNENLQTKWAYFGIAGLELPEDPGLGRETVTREHAALRGMPVIDGEIDEIWLNAPPLETSIDAMPSTGARAQVRLLWDDTHVYVLAEVQDGFLSSASSQNYEHDSFEVFLDENNAKTASYEPDDAQYRVSFENTKSIGGQTGASYLQSAVSLTPEGYRVEMAIELRFIQPEEGTLLGMDFQVNDDQGSGARDAIAKWNDPTNESWRNTSGWGVIRLKL